MPIITGGKVIEGSGLATPLRLAGSPVDGTDEVQTLTIGGTPTGGTFKLTFDGHTTAPITWTAVDATLVTAIDTALEALPNIGTGGVVVADTTITSGIGAVSITFSGAAMAKAAQPLITATNNLTGTAPTVAVAETTPGVTASFRDAPLGALLVDVTNGGIYQNVGTPGAPTWQLSGDLTGVTASAAELNLIDDSVAGTAVASKALVLGANKNVDTLVVADGGLKLGAAAGTAVGATAAEINNVADVSARVQTLTASGAVTAGVQSLQLNHATVVIAATIATAVGHPGLFVVKNTSASGTAAHTVTITTGTWNGTNKVITLDAPNECLIVYFDSAGNGTIIENVGTVGLSG